MTYVIVSNTFSHPRLRRRDNRQRVIAQHYFSAGGSSITSYYCYFNRNNKSKSFQGERDSIIKLDLFASSICGGHFISYIFPLKEETCSCPHEMLNLLWLWFNKVLNIPWRCWSMLPWQHHTVTAYVSFTHSCYKFSCSLCVCVCITDTFIQHLSTEKYNVTAWYLIQIQMTRNPTSHFFLMNQLNRLVNQYETRKISTWIDLNYSISVSDYWGDHIFFLFICIRLLKRQQSPKCWFYCWSGALETEAKRN